MIIGIVLALLSLFSVFYIARLRYVTRGLTAIRPGGQGAYVGAIVFLRCSRSCLAGRVATLALEKMNGFPPTRPSPGARALGPVLTLV